MRSGTLSSHGGVHLRPSKPSIGKLSSFRKCSSTNAAILTTGHAGKPHCQFTDPQAANLPPPARQNRHDHPQLRPTLSKIRKSTRQQLPPPQKRRLPQGRTRRGRSALLFRLPLSIDLSTDRENLSSRLTRRRVSRGGLIPFGTILVVGSSRHQLFVHRQH